MSGGSQPSLQLAADHDEEVGIVQFEDEARLRLDEMRILVALGNRLDGDFVAANLTHQRRKVLSGRDHLGQLRRRWRRNRQTQKQRDSS